jgi:hypothetical protein
MHMKAKAMAISIKSKSLNILHRIRHNRVVSLAVFALNDNDRHNAIDQVNRQAHLFIVLTVAYNL